MDGIGLKSLPCIKSMSILNIFCEGIPISSYHNFSIPSPIRRIHLLDLCISNVFSMKFLTATNPSVVPSYIPSYSSSSAQKSIIDKPKAHFAAMGIPDTVIGDTGPHFTTFAHLSKKWGFEHTVLSPHHSRSNGPIESSVKSGKND